MSYQGGNPHQEGHDLQQYPPSTYHMPPAAQHYDSDDEQQERAPLNTQPGASPFDDLGSSQHGHTGYTLEEQYAPSPAPGYSESPGYDQPRVPSPYNRSETSSTEAWRQRQAPTTGLRRYATRKIKLTAGQALSIDHPVPSAIQNAIQTKYRQSDIEGGSEEFTHMRCNEPHPPTWPFGG